MTFKIVQCEVRWIACIGYSGTERPPSTYETLGEYEDEGDACRALAEAGLARTSYGWRGEYSTGYVQRTLKEVQ
jgi:hypothetical protein